MTRLASFGRDLNVAIIGASGGIGAAMCRLLAEDQSVARVFACSRTAIDLGLDRVAYLRLDIEDEASIAAAATELHTIPLDVVLVLSGLLHDGDSVRPERRLSELDPVAMQRVFSVNAIGPAIVAKHFLPLLRPLGKTVFAALSARVGSIGDNRLGGWATYRASKAALNQFVRTASIEHARRRRQSLVVALHPGTVDTRLSKPFTARTPQQKLFTAERSAGCLLQVIDELTAADTGGFFAWDGTRIEF